MNKTLLNIWGAGLSVMLTQGTFVAQGEPTRTVVASPDIRRDATVVAIESALPGVVNINAKSTTKRQGYFYDWWRDAWAPFTQEMPPETSAGSGVIIDEEGYVLTNIHVIEDATEISIKLNDGRVLPAQVVSGTRRSDVALLKIIGQKNDRFNTVRFATDDDLLLGETVIALGNPFGLGGSVSRGILSAKTRRAQAEDGLLDREDWLQTDAAINPGNSGGALINLRGELIGLNVAIYKEGNGIGFAIPIKRVNEAISEIFTPEGAAALWFGARVQAGATGLIVARVEPQSPAGKSGLTKGDIILRVNDQIPRTVFAFNRELLKSGDKEEVNLSIQRGDARQSISLQLVAETTFFNADLIRRKLGCTVQELTPAIALRAGLDSIAGVIITAVDKESPAGAANLGRGMIILGLNNQGINGITSTARFLNNLSRGTAVKASVLAGRPLRRVVVELRVR